MPDAPCWRIVATLFGEYGPGAARFNRIDQRHVYTGASIRASKRIRDQELFAPRMELKQGTKRNAVTRWSAWRIDEGRWVP